MSIVITNTETGQTRQAAIITDSDGDLRWCIATWPTAEYGYGWQVVRDNGDGTYTYNNSMRGSYLETPEEVRQFAVASGYQLL